MQVSQVIPQCKKSSVSFQSLNLQVSKSDGFMFKSVRQALAPKPNELVSKIVRLSESDAISIVEQPNEELVLRVSPAGEDCMSESVSVFRKSTDTVKSFARQIQASLDALYDSINKKVAREHI